MANKNQRPAHNDKKQKGEGKKNKPKTQYQLEREQTKALKHRTGKHGSLG